MARRTWAFWCVTVLVLGAASWSQSSDAWDTDDHGFRQWKTFASADCSECRGQKVEPCGLCQVSQRADCVQCAGDRSAPCSVCAGSGKTHDPYVDRPCPQCKGTAVSICTPCKASGILRLEGGPKSGKCTCCTGRGAIECTMCSGKRIVAIVRPGGQNVRQAKRETLTAVLTSLSALREKVDAWAYAASATDQQNAKSYADAASGARTLAPEAARHGAGMQVWVKSLARLQGYYGHELWVAESFDRHERVLLDLLDLQIEVLNQCLERLDFNDKRAAAAAKEASKPAPGR
jgi:hypothetical protein